MRAWVLVASGALAAGCATGRTGTSLAPPATPSPSSPSPAVSPPPPAPPAAPTTHGSDPVRYGPSALRYVVHRQLHIQQSLGDQIQIQNVGARIFVAVTISGPADSVGYPTTFTVDSIAADSGMPPVIADNITKVRKLVFAGRVVRRGEFVNAVASDSALAQSQSVGQVLGNFRDFLPRLPLEGLKPGATWTDTVTTTQKGSDAAGSRRSIVHATAMEWPVTSGRPSLRVETTQTYEVTGSGKNTGQPYELSGTGTASGTAFITTDGRYLGGEARDSTTLTIRLPMQGMAVPVIQVAHTTVAVLP
ncbi:MAG TPA: hypothetical protein VFD76_03485 [Gemmatimonadales bacterium]|nr:hypothetical protein [Gemmatimonadales bacterium]